MIIVTENLALFNFYQCSGIRQNSVNVVMCPPSPYTWVNFGLLKIFTFENEIDLLYNERKFLSDVRIGLCCTLPLLHPSAHWLSATLSRPFKEIIVWSNTIIFFDITAKWKKSKYNYFLIGKCCSIKLISMYWICLFSLWRFWNLQVSCCFKQQSSKIQTPLSNKISILCASHLQLWAKISDFLQAQGRRLKIISCTNVHCWLIHY